MNSGEIINFFQKNEIFFSKNEDLSKHNSIKIGGKCDFFVLPDGIKKLIKVIQFAKKHNIQYYIVGNGTNTLFDDNDFAGLVICTKNLKNYEINGKKIFAECGLGLFELGKICAKNGLSGIEFCYGIPGSIGGAIKTNAGAFQKSIGDFVEFVKIYHNGQIVDISQNDMQFGYRTSVVENSDMIVLGVQLNLNKGEALQIEKLQKEFFEKKLASQPYDKLSLGSVFKRNSKYEPVSKLIDDLGLKGFQIGGAQVSTKHAGFLINNGNSTCKDFVLLIQYIQQKIFESFGFVPQLEIKFAGDKNASFWGLSHSHNL